MTDPPPAIDHAPVKVRNDLEHHRFVVDGDGAIAELVYQLDGDRLVLVHTEVPAELEGHGIGGQLVAAAADWARADHLVVAPWCPYARHWLRRHADAVADLSIDWTPPA